MNLIAIKWVRNEDGSGHVEVLDQLLLPFKSEYLKVENTTAGFDIIRKMQVRGAPAIAIAGCLSLAAELANTTQKFDDLQSLHDYIIIKSGYLVTARPTAVNMKTARDCLIDYSNSLRIKQMQESEYKERIISWCVKMLENDVSANKNLGAFGRDKILQETCNKKLNLLTHCNTGSLATAGYGTALGVVRSLFEANKLEHVYCCETRPYNQGARLTAYELVYENIPSTLICDSMVGALMSSRKCDAVVVGADRITTNGDTANKIGTYQIAVLAKYHKIPFYVCAATTTIDFHKTSGQEIIIEERPADEMTCIGEQRIAAPGINCWNPAFDVTPAELITGIITEEGVFRPHELLNSVPNLTKI